MADKGPSLTSVKHEYSAPLLNGVLIKRYKRFLADVELYNGHTVICHCPNSGSMLGCAEPGSPVALSYHGQSGRKTAHTWEMVKANNVWVCINTGIANKIVQQAAANKMPPFFENALTVKPEVKINQHTRLDLLVETNGAPIYVEVKSVTLVDNACAMFPDAVTTRGHKHLDELIKLKASGMEALMVYLVQREDANRFTPARHIDHAYADKLAEAVEAGVKVLVWQTKASPGSITLWRRLPWSLT